MGKYAVIIPTTKGLSRVQQIRVDEQLRHAVMTVNFRTERSAVTIDYAEYVAQDAGIISHITQEYRYRVKLSRDIITGTSWKLGMLAAHVLKQSDALAEVEAPFRENATAAELVGDSESVIWATGDVSDEYGVLPVAQVKRKLELSQSLFDWCQTHSVRVSVYLPSVLDNDPQENQAIENSLQKLENHFSMLQVHRIERAPKRIQGWGVSNSPSPKPFPSRLTRVAKPILICAASLITVAILSVGTLSLTDKMSQTHNSEKPENVIATTVAPKIKVTILYDPNGACFLNRERLEELTVLLRDDPVKGISIPSPSRTCRVDVELDPSEQERWTIGVEGDGVSSDETPITLSQTRMELRQPFYMARPKAIVFLPKGEATSTEQETRIEVDYASHDR